MIYDMIYDISVDSTFLYGGIKLKVVESDDSLCKGCYFRYKINCPCNVTCFAKDRKDNKDVHFEEVKE